MPIVVAIHPAGATGTTTYTGKQTIPVPPASAYLGSAGGDGWGVALTPTRVYNVFHHDSTLQVACHLQSDAGACYAPITLTDGTGGFSGSGMPGLEIDQTTAKLYVYTTRNSDATAGVACFDTKAADAGQDPYCGFTALSGVGEASLNGYSQVSDPVLIGDEWFAFNHVGGSASTGSRNRLMCFVISTAAPCSGQPYATGQDSSDVSTASLPAPALAAIGSQVIGVAPTTGGERLFCVSAASHGSCTGAWPVTLTGGGAQGFGAPFPMLDSAGTPVGVCLPNAAGTCFDLEGGAVEPPAQLPGVIGASDQWNGPALTIGPRVLVPNGNTNTVNCFDYSTRASCTNYPHTLNDLGYLYTVNRDPQRPDCVWVNADNGGAQIQNFDAYSGGACGEGPIRVLASTSVVSSSTCTPSSYTALQVLDPTRDGYTDGSVTFLDGDGNQLQDEPDKDLDNGGTVSLVGMDLNTETGLPQFLIQLNGTPDKPSEVTIQLTWTGTDDDSCTKPGTTKGTAGHQVAMGDSFSSGEGTFDYEAGTDQKGNRCHRSPHAYGPRLNSQLSLGTLTFVACSGAVTQDFFAPNHSNSDESKSQISALDDSVTTVTFTIGGNDAGFAHVIDACVRARPDRWDGYGCSKDKKLTKQVDANIKALRGKGSAQTFDGQNIIRILSLLRRIHQLAPNAEIVVAGYPRFFGTETKYFYPLSSAPSRYACDVGSINGSQATMDFRDAQWMNKTQTTLNDAIAGEVRLAASEGIPASFVDPTSAFGSHAFCAASSNWFNELYVLGLNADASSFHPTEDGQGAYVSAISGIPEF